MVIADKKIEYKWLIYNNIEYINKWFLYKIFKFQKILNS